MSCFRCFGCGVRDGADTARRGGWPNVETQAMPRVRGQETLRVRLVLSQECVQPVRAFGHAEGAGDQE